MEEVSMGGGVKNVSSKAELDKAVGEGNPVILHFWAVWCDASKHMDQVFSHLSIDFPNAYFLRVEAEEQPEISEKYNVSAVPYFVFFKGGKPVDTLEGADPSSLANKVAKVAGSVNPDESAASARVGLAAGPTVLETVKELAKNNGTPSVANQSSSGSAENLNKKLQQLINSHPVMLFMKGSPEEPKCGFSQKVVDILKKEGVKFGSFDILNNHEVREGLKKFSNWPTYPQLYCKGELLGGCDIVIAMHEGGELKEALSDHGTKTADSTGLSSFLMGQESLDERLKRLINGSDVMVFMKGTPDEPRCGFSSKVVNALREEGVTFGSFDILSDEEVRQGLKKLSNWPTYPQLYYKGELVGGCDIVLEMRNNGELKQTLSDCTDTETGRENDNSLKFEGGFGW